MGIREWFDRRIPDTSPVPSSDESRAEAKCAIARSQNDLDDASSRGERVRKITAALRSQMERNHFGELLEQSMQLRGTHNA